MERAHALRVCAGMAQWLLQQRDPTAAQWVRTTSFRITSLATSSRTLPPSFAKRWVGPHGFMAPPPHTCLLRQVAWPLGGAIRWRCSDVIPEGPCCVHGNLLRRWSRILQRVLRELEPSSASLPTRPPETRRSVRQLQQCTLGYDVNFGSEREKH